MDNSSTNRAALGCMDIKAGIMVCGLIVLDVFMYYPFFKLLERQKLEEENGSLGEDDNLLDKDIFTTA